MCAETDDLTQVTRGRMARPTASNLGGCSYGGATGSLFVAQIPKYTTSWTILSAQIWELCLIYMHVHYLHYLHVRYYTFTLYKSLMIFYRVMLLYLYTFNT